MRILVVTTSYPRHRDDAAGGFVRTRVEALRAAGHTVDVVAAASNSASADGPDVVRVTGPCRDVELFYSGGAPEQLEAQPARAALAGLGFYAALVAALRSRLHVDAIESHWLLPSTLAVIALGARGAAHRAHVHGGDVAVLERMPGGAALARVVVRGATLVFASGDLRARLAALVGPDLAPVVRAAEVVPAESALVRAPPVRDGAKRTGAQLALGVRGPVVLAVGRLVPIKGHHLLVRALARLPASHVRPTLVVLGEGPERARLAALAAARGVTLHLPGAVAPATVAAWLACADVFVHPSLRLASGRTEGSPVAVREALAARIPVIASDAGGLAAFAGHPDVTLVSAADPPTLLEGLTTALAEVLASPSPPALPATVPG